MAKKIVRFKDWCNICEWFGKEQWDNPCHECLSTPAREDSRRPLNYQKQTSLRGTKNEQNTSK